MRGAWREVREHFESKEGRPAFANRYASIEDLRDKLSWSRARMVLRGIKFNDDDDWREHKADELAELLTNHVGNKLMQYPGITANALRKLHPDLPRALIYEWAHEAADVIKELAEQVEMEIELRVCKPDTANCRGQCHTADQSLFPWEAGLSTPNTSFRGV
jgi:hypothetical protein